MRRFIALLALLASFCVPSTKTQAQEYQLTNPNGLTIDSVSNATPEGPYARVPGSISTVSFGMEVTKISGTLAGKIYLQGAVRSGQWLTPYLDSVTVSDASANYRFSSTSPPYQYYRLYWVGSGTMSASYRATLYIRKPQ